jgi:hypothetical protein
MGSARSVTPCANAEQPNIKNNEQQVTVSFLYPSSKADEQSLASLCKALDLGLWRLAKRNQSFHRDLALTRGIRLSPTQKSVPAMTQTEICLL